ncbi:MAG TPA: YqaA family protein [Beijerinckiaceae bacterium]|nr:YqaA family protein [Beijerinckiaceae bacterium]
MIQALYDWTMRLAAHRRAKVALFAVSFAESSFFPIPPDVLLIPMILADRARAWFYATLCTVASVLGGVAGYLIGLLLFDLVGRPLLALYGYGARFEQFAASYNEWGAWIVMMGGLTPFPYKVITIASGVTHLDIWVFLIASVLSRGGRFFIVAGLLYLFGPPIRSFIEQRLGLVAAVGFALLVGGFVVARLLAG